MMKWQKALLYCKQKESCIWKEMLSPLNKPNKHYGFIGTGDWHSPSLACIICGNWLSNKATKPSKLLFHIGTKSPTLKDKSLEFFKRKKNKHEEQKQLLKVTTLLNMSALTVSFLVTNSIAKAKKSFTIGKSWSCLLLRTLLWPSNFSPSFAMQ